MGFMVVWNVRGFFLSLLPKFICLTIYVYCFSVVYVGRTLPSLALIGGVTTKNERQHFQYKVCKHYHTRSIQQQSRTENVRKRNHVQ